MTREEAIAEMRRCSRLIISAHKAEELAEAFGFTLNDLALRPQHREQGANWNTREDVWEEGEGLGTYEVAQAIADGIKAPDVPYPTDYAGRGKRAAAVTTKNVRRIEKALEISDA